MAWYVILFFDNSNTVSRVVKVPTISSSDTSLWLVSRSVEIFDPFLFNTKRHDKRQFRLDATSKYTQISSLETLPIHLLQASTAVILVGSLGSESGGVKDPASSVLGVVDASAGRESTKFLAMLAVDIVSYIFLSQFLDIRRRGSLVCIGY